MPPIALALVVAAAALHTGWNLIVKRVNHKQIFAWWALVAGSLLYLPLVLPGISVPVQAWPYIILSGIVEAIYFMFLTRAYQMGDFSLIYPIARGAAPALLAVWAVLFLAERPEPAGVIGLLVLLVGLMVVGGGQWWSQRGTVSLSAGGIGAALSVALCISIYSAIDAAAVRFISPAPYLVLTLVLTGLVLTPYVLVYYGCPAVIASGRKDWRAALGVGVLMPLTYLLVLQAYSVARASYVGALREISIVMAAVVGWRWLGDRFGRARTAGAMLIFAGIFIIAAAG